MLFPFPRKKKPGDKKAIKKIVIEMIPTTITDKEGKKSTHVEFGINAEGMKDEEKLGTLLAAFIQSAIAFSKFHKCIRKNDCAPKNYYLAVVEHISALTTEFHKHVKKKPKADGELQSKK